jgi:raffinose/stachyose/melibiose transport system substrate-binding protein
MKGNSMIKNRGGKLAAALAATALAATSVVALGGAANAANTITIWGVTAQQGKSGWTEVVNAFKAKYPQYNVDYKEVGLSGTYQQTITTALQAGNAPDIFKVAGGAGEVDSLQKLAKAKYLLDLAGTAANNFAAPLERANFQYAGKTYGLPVDKNVGVVVANLSLMQQDGLTWPKTFSELLDQCKTAVAKGKSFFGFAGGAVPNQNLINAATGGVAYADTLKKAAGKLDFANSVGWRTNFENQIAMNKAGCFQKGYEAGGFGDAIDARFFGLKSYAVFVPGGTSFVFRNFVPPLKGQDIVTAYIPGKTAADTRIPVSLDYAWAANARTKNLAAVKVFMNFAASVTGQKYYTDAAGSLPVKTTGTLPDNYKLMTPFLKAGKTYPIPYTLFSNPEVTARMAAGTIGTMSGQVGVSKVLKSMDSAW